LKIVKVLVEVIAIPADGGSILYKLSLFTIARV